LEKLRTASEEEFQRLTAHAQRPPNSEMGYVTSDSSQTDIRDLSAREIEDIADKAAMFRVERWRASPRSIETCPENFIWAIKVSKIINDT